VDGGQGRALRKNLKTVTGAADLKFADHLPHWERATPEHAHGLRSRTLGLWQVVQTDVPGLDGLKAAAMTRARWDPVEIRSDGSLCPEPRIVREVEFLRLDRGRLVGRLANGESRFAELHERGEVVLDTGQQAEGVAEYVSARLDAGDVIDIALDENNLIVGVWIHVYYENNHLRARYGGTMTYMKSDALFAARTNPARRSEHWVAGQVLAPVGHEVAAMHRVDNCGRFRFVIDYSVMDRRTRSEDLRCLRCGRRFEVKARLRDYYRRPSHSRSRPFESENEPGDFHVFHYRRDGTYEVLLNAEIAEVADRMADSGRVGEVDRFLDLGRKGGSYPRALTSDEYRCQAG
jgi:hypothetical protein